MMTDIKAILLIPHKGDPHGLLKGGPCGAQPPMVVRVGDAWATPWVSPTDQMSNQPLHMVREGRRYAGWPDWLCNHCGEGKVELIPDDCPNCGKRLTRPVDVLGELKVQEDNRFLDSVERVIDGKEV